MPRVRHDDIMLRLIKDVNDVRSALRRIVAVLPLYDIDNENTPAQLTTVQNNYALGNYDVLRLSSDKIVSITGMRKGVKGRKVRLFNVGSFSILIPHQSFSSDAENRIKLQGGKNPVYLTSVEPNTNMQFYYDSTQQRWLTVAAPPAYDIGEDWEAVSAPVFTKDVCWCEDLGLFVAVGTDTCMTSPDGQVWTQQTIPTGNYTGVVWNSSLSLFLAVALGTSTTPTKLAFSSNGTAWSQRIGAWHNYQSVTGGHSGYSTFIAWSPSLRLFCEVGSSQYVKTSPDGINWTAQTPSENNTWTSVCWSSDLGLFCAVSSDGTNRVMTSADGINWNAEAAAEANTWTSVCWSSDLGLFCAVSRDGTNRVMTSADGSTWNAHAAAEANIWECVCWAPALTLFCAVSIDGTNRVMTSADGSTWNAHAAASARQWHGVTWSEDLGLFVAVGDSVADANCFMSSANGTNWTTRIAPETSNWRSVAWSAELGIFVAVSRSTHATTTYAFATSTNGIDWTGRFYPYGSSTAEWFFNALSWAPELGIFCVASSTGFSISENPAEEVPRAYSDATNDVINVAVGASLCKSSTDGLVWTTHTIAAQTFYDVCWAAAENLFVAVSHSTVCSISADGIVWTSQTIPNGDWNGVTYAPELGLFVACSSATNYIATSANGIDWVARTAPAGTWNEIMWCPEISLLIVVGTDSSMVSADGINWTIATTVIAGTWEGAAWSPDLVTGVAVASAGANKAMKVP